MHKQQSATLTRTITRHIESPTMTGGTAKEDMRPSARDWAISGAVAAIAAAILTCIVGTFLIWNADNSFSTGCANGGGTPYILSDGQTEEGVFGSYSAPVVGVGHTRLCGNP